MSVEPPYTEEFPKGMTVTDWERTLIALYSSKLGPTHHEHRTNFRITGLRRYKEQSGVQHEYLVAEVSFQDLERYLRIERAPIDVSATNDTPPSKEGVHAVSNRASQSSLGSSKKLAALDDVKTITNWPRE